MTHRPASDSDYMAPATCRIEKGLYWGRALSLVEGCQPVSQGCDHCWSAKQTAMRCKQDNKKMQARYGGLLNEKGEFNGTARLMWDDIQKPNHIKTPTTWAVWNDLFGWYVSFEFQYKTFEMMLQNPRHTFIICTKQAELMRYSVDEIYFHLKCNYPDATTPLPNVILMVTAENQYWANNRIPCLLRTPAAIRGVSVEPVLENINIKKYLEIASEGEWMNMIECGIVHPKLDWVIVGEESGPNARRVGPEPIRHLISQCKSASVPVFLKQMYQGNKLVKLPQLDGKVYSQFPSPPTRSDPS